MRSRKSIIFLRILAIFTLLFFGCPSQSVRAQSSADRKPIDMMLVVDNSCSMFPQDKIVPGCEVWGNDPDFLRIDGVNLFLARLGFAEVNELEYQAGVISLGKPSKLIAPLQPVSGARDALSRLIADPAPELGTDIVGAIKLAYEELRTSPNRRAMNLPAVVLLTDGRPYPAAGQSDAVIEQLVSANPDIPFFIMLLQDPTDPDYERYVRFWEQMQTRNEHIFTYRIADRKQIEATYNRIIAQLQNTVPGGGGISVTPDMPEDFFVSQCVQEIIVTVQHESGTAKGAITIQDPKGNSVDFESTPGVKRFRGMDNPVEVISIGESRLTDDLKDGSWTIASDKPVTVHLDRRGAYQINFVAPDVSLTDINNVYLATEQQTPTQEFIIRFTLTSDCYGSEHQPIWGNVIHPDGQQALLRIPDAIAPDSSGVYEIRFDFASAYPAVMDTPGRFIFILNAGSALGPDAPATEDRVPIATARLLVDVGRAPYITDVTPAPLVYGGGENPELTVKVGDYDLAVKDSIQVRAFGGGHEVQLEPTSPGVFSGDLSEVYAALSAGAACSTHTDATLRLRLTAQLKSGTMPPVERDVPVQVLAPTCTPTPTPTNTPTPTPPPTPTPCPDRDGDGFNDCGEDRCPDRAGISQLEGCPWWPYLVGGILGLGLLAFIIFYIIPWIIVHISPPPKGYVLACRGSTVEKGPLSTYNVGMAKRRRKITIGGNRKKAHIYIKDLKPVEFYVAQAGNDIKIFDATTGAAKATFRDYPADVSTSVSGVKLRVGLDQTKLRC